MEGRRLNRRLAGFVAFVVLAIGAPAGRAVANEPSKSLAAPSKAWLHALIQQTIQATRTASWIHDSWETKDGKTEQSRSKCFWTNDGRLRMEVIDGHGSGSTIVLQGDRVTIRPFGIFGLFRMHYNVSDSTVRSVRGNELNHTSFVDDLSRMLETWDRAEVTFSPKEVVVSYLNRQNLPTRGWIQLDPFELRKLEVTEDGKVVERTLYDQVHVGEGLDPKLFELDH